MAVTWSEPGKFFGWKALAVAAAMYFALTGLLLYSFPVFLPFLRDTFGWSRASISWANSLALIVQGLASPLAGMYVMRCGARRALAAGGILCVLCFVVASFHTRLWELYLAYAVLFGLGGSLCGMLAMTTIVNNWFIKKRPLALSILLTAGGLGGLVMVPIITAMINRFGWRSSYLALAVMIFVLLVVLPGFLVVNKPEDLGQVADGIQAEEKKDLSPNMQDAHRTPMDFTASEAIRTSAFWYLTILATTFMMGIQGFMLHQLVFLDDINISKGIAAIAYGLFVGVGAVGRLGMGFLGIRYPTKPLAIMAMLLMILGLSITLWARTLPIIFLYNVLIGLGLGGTYVAIMNLIPLYFGKTHYPQIIGFALPFSTVLGSIGSPLAGWIRDSTGSYKSAWELSILILAIGLVSLILARPPMHPSIRQSEESRQHRKGRSPMYAIKTGLAIAFLVTVVLLPLNYALADETDSRKTCESLASLSTQTYRVDTSQWVAASSQPAGRGGTASEVPAHCLFRVTLDPRPSGMEGLSYGTGIELRLPLAWNGRLLFQGGGGLDGTLSPAYGSVSGFPSALVRGFAVVSTDGGHRSRGGSSIVDARFAVDQQAKLDFAYQSVQQTIRESKALINRYYGRKPDYSYFMGCSTGGREAMLAAQRLPLEFDGVVAGNASFNLTRVAMNQIWSLQTVTRIAPKDSTGKPQLHEAFTDAQLKAVSEAVLKQCDGLDGLQDGMINDFKACHFDPTSMRCGTEAGAGAQPCFSKQQVDGLKDIFGGARNSRGESLYGATPYDTGIAQPAWRSMHLGTATAAPANASLGRDTLRLFAMTPFYPEFDPLHFDFDHDMDTLAETAAINDAVATLHTTFAGHGGKMIVYHGLSDQAMWTGALTQWYERLTPRESQGPQSWARLFLVPGMTHCGGGQSTDQFDMLTAIQQWVEKGQAPDRVIASGRAFPGKTRPLCPYPKVARFDGGNPDDQKSFSCR